MNSQDALLNEIHNDLHGRSVINACPGNTSDGTEAYTKRILLTGGAGFIGSALVRKLVLNYPEYFVLVIDKLDYCSSLNNLHPFLPSPTLSAQLPRPPPPTNFKFIHGDITDCETVQTAMTAYQIDTVIHLAAQTHVDKSFGESIEFTKNNVLGAHVMLEAARKAFSESPVLGSENGVVDTETKADKIKRMASKRFIYVSTDEVYGEVPFGQPDCKEDAPLAPSNPYSATKAAAECMVQAYHKSFHLPVIITRSNNVYGPSQYPEKIFPKFIMSLLNASTTTINSNTAAMSHLNGIDTHGKLRADFSAANGKSKSQIRSQRRTSLAGGHCFIHGSGEHSRTYLYVTDVADALDVILHRGEVGQVYNIGAGHEINNLAFAKDLIHRMVAVPEQQQQEEEDEAEELRADGDRRGLSIGQHRHQETVRHLKKCMTCAERIVFVEDRAFNDRRYAVDATKLLNLGWSPKVDFEDGIQKTIDWYRDYGRSWWGDIHRALYPHSVRLSAEYDSDSAATSTAAPSPLPSQAASPLLAASPLRPSSPKT
ncbi:hypothetical protein BGZ98_004960 [Dissophora globulifera]|nr:hypothetical protein BGZ98_004960 [Dissophora globulifera]